MKEHKQCDTDVIRYGLYYLIHRSIEPRPREDAMSPMGLYRHPFGLPLPFVPEHPPMVSGPIQFLGEPGVTDVSIKSFARAIAQQIGEYSWQMKPRYLRIMNVQASTQETFFEAGLEHVILICGGCNDAPGSTGGRGAETLTSIFQLLSLVSATAIERVTINSPHAQVYRAMLEEELYEAQQSGRLVTRQLDHYLVSLK